MCCARKDVRVDLLEFKTYAEIDLDETPIAVLGCGHFFTGETLDGLVGMDRVYTRDKFGNYNGLQDPSGLSTVPTCPDCRVPIHQFATRRYNRAINRAVLDETSKRFLVSGRRRLEELEGRVAAAEEKLSETRGKISVLFNMSSRYKTIMGLQSEAVQLVRDMDAEHQPTKKLFDTALTFQRLESETRSPTSQAALDGGFQLLTLNPAPERQPVYDQQITLGAGRLQLTIQESILRDQLALQSTRRANLRRMKFSRSGSGSPFTTARNSLPKQEKPTFPALLSPPAWRRPASSNCKGGIGESSTPGLTLVMAPERPCSRKGCKHLEVPERVKGLEMRLRRHGGS